MTNDQYEQLCALTGVSQSSRSRELGRLVLVEGMNLVGAAKQCGLSYNAAWQAVQKRTKAVRLIESISKTKIL